MPEQAAFQAPWAPAISTVRLYRGGFIDLKMSVVPVLSAFVGSLGARIALMVPPSVFQIILVLCLPVAAFLVMRDKTLSPDGEEMEQKKRWLMLGLVSLPAAPMTFYGPGAGTFMLLGFAAAAKLGVRDAAGQMKIVNFSSGIAALVLLRGHGPRRLGARRPCRMLRHHGPLIGSGLVMKNGGRDRAPHHSHGARHPLREDRLGLSGVDEAWRIQTAKCMRAAQCAALFQLEAAWSSLFHRTRAPQASHFNGR